MPILKPCRSSCSYLVSQEKPCPIHGRYLKPSEQLRQNQNQGYTYRWSKYSKSFLARHPLCAIGKQEGRIEASQCVDHIRPVLDDQDPLFWDTTNHQALCWSCHSKKTVKDYQMGLTRQACRIPKRR